MSAPLVYRGVRIQPCACGKNGCQWAAQVTSMDGEDTYCVHCESLAQARDAIDEALRAARTYAINLHALSTWGL